MTHRACTKLTSAGGDEWLTISNLVLVIRMRSADQDIVIHLCKKKTPQVQKILVYNDLNLHVLWSSSAEWSVGHNIFMLLASNHCSSICPSIFHGTMNMMKMWSKYRRWSQNKGLIVHIIAHNHWKQN